MIEFVIIETAVLFLGTLYVLHKYAAKNIAFPIKASVFVPWFLCFVIIILVPLDIYYSKVKPNPEIKAALQTIWKILYWSIFGITWILLPFLQEYVEVGEFTFKAKMKKAFKATLISYGIYILGGVLILAALLYFGVISSFNMKESLITFSNCFGVFLIIICLGFGLVAIPKRYLQKTNKTINLNYSLYHLAEAEDTRTNLQIELEDLIKLIHLLSCKKDISEEHKDLLHTVLEQCTADMIQLAKQTLNSTDNENVKEFGKVDYDRIIELNHKLRCKIAEVNRQENNYETTLKEALTAEDVLQCSNPTEWGERNHADLSSGCSKCMNSLQWLWFTKIEQIAFFFLGISFGIFSLAAFLAETLTFLKISFFSIEKFIENDNDNFIAYQFICLIPLLYIFLCVYHSLFKMKLGGLYGFYPNKHTDAASLLFASVNFSRVSTPLVFNFLQMFQITDTAFITIMGNANVAINFTKYCPLLLVFLILCNSFDLYGRVLGALGLQRFKFSENFNDEKITEGKELLQRARRMRGVAAKEAGKGSPSSSPTETSGYSLNAKLLKNAASNEDLESSPGGSPDNLLGKGSSRRKY